MNKAAKFEAQKQFNRRHRNVEEFVMIMKLTLLICVILSAALWVLPALTQGAEYEPYDRAKHFGSRWIDADHDCQDTRQEVLIAESKVPVTLSDDGCKVLSGYWVCPFTDRVFFTPFKMDVDHLDPLKEAYESGAWAWTKEKRVAYANDLDNPDHLMAVALGANRSKGAKDPYLSLPEINRYHYAQVWIKIKKNYGLTFDANEVETLMAIERQYGHCNE